MLQLELQPIEILQNSSLIQDYGKEKLIRKTTAASKINTEIRGKGLMLSAIMKNSEIASQVVQSLYGKRINLIFLVIRKKLKLNYQKIDVKGLKKGKIYCI